MVVDRRTRITPAAAGTHSPTPPGSRGEHMPYVSPPVPQNTLNRGIKNYPLRSETTEPRRQRRLIFQHSGEQVGCRIHSEQEWEQLVRELCRGSACGATPPGATTQWEPRHQRQLCHLPASGWPRSKAISQQRVPTCSSVLPPSKRSKVDLTQATPRFFSARELGKAAKS